MAIVWSYTGLGWIRTGLVMDRAELPMGWTRLGKLDMCSSCVGLAVNWPYAGLAGQLLTKRLAGVIMK